MLGVGSEGDCEGCAGVAEGAVAGGGCDDEVAGAEGVAFFNCQEAVFLGPADEATDEASVLEVVAVSVVIVENEGGICSGIYLQSHGECGPGGSVFTWPYSRDDASCPDENIRSCGVAK